MDHITAKDWNKQTNQPTNKKRTFYSLYLQKIASIQRITLTHKTRFQKKKKVKHQNKSN